MKDSAKYISEDNGLQSGAGFSAESPVPLCRSINLSTQQNGSGMDKTS